MTFIDLLRIIKGQEVIAQRSTGCDIKWRIETDESHDATAGLYPVKPQNKMALTSDSN